MGDERAPRPTADTQERGPQEGGSQESRPQEGGQDRAGNPLICALDTDDLGLLSELAAAVGPEVGHLKVGLQAFIAHGRVALNRAAEHAPVFLDLKLHDIPNTVAGAARAVADAGAVMLTVHAAGGPAMVEAAVEAAPGIKVLGVTVLTSLDDATLASLGQPGVGSQVPRLASIAAEAGAAGIVCAPTDVIAARGAVGPQPLVVVPGVRPPDAPGDDQARTGTPRAAVQSGADHIVVGRPITRASDPAAAARKIREELR